MENNQAQCSCYCCNQGRFDGCVGELGDHAVDDDLVNDELDLLDEPLDPEMLTFIIEGSHAALYNAPKSLELFYLLKMVRKTIPDSDKIDNYGHTIQNGSEYIGYYLGKVKETKGKVFYKQLNNFMYVYLGEIFCLAVLIIKDIMHDSARITVFIWPNLYLATISEFTYENSKMN